MGTVNGIFNSSNFVTGQTKPSFSSMITRYMPNGSAPLFGLTSMLKSETALSAEHGFWTKTMVFPSVTLSAAGQAVGDTIFTVSSTNNIIPGMVLRVDSTGENVLVQSILSTTQFGVRRAVGSTAAAAIAASINLYQVGTAFEESSTRPQAQSITPVRITNFTQIFRNTWAISDSARATQMLVGETNIAESKQDCAFFHAADIERALFFGQKYSGQMNSQPLRMMDGLISIISNIANYPSSYSSANVTVAGATTNYTQLETALDPCFNQSTDPTTANERVLFVGGDAKKVLNNIGRLNGTYQLVDGQTTYGLQFSTIKIARGTFRIIEHPMFNSNNSWKKMAVAVDLSSFGLAYLGDRQTQNKEFNMAGDSVSDNGVDAVGGTLTTELTTVVKNPPANAVITNLIAGAAG